MLNFDQLNLSKCADGLLPVVVQDATTLRVLMLGYMNREAFEKTQAEGRVTFYSRTRQSNRSEQKKSSVRFINISCFVFHFFAFSDSK